MVIVNYRTPDLTMAAVASVLSEPEVREVVVVDNASDDGSAAQLRGALQLLSAAQLRGATDQRVKVVESPQNGGFGAGVNRGALECTGPLLFVLNSDAAVRPGCLRLLAEALVVDDAVGIVAPAVYGPDGISLEPATFGALPDPHQVVLGHPWARFGGRRQAPAEPEWVSGVAMLLRKSDFTRVGRFDEAFTMYFEDIDLCRRILDGGKSVRRVPAAAVVHAGGGSWRSNSAKRRRFHESKVLYLEKVGATPFELRCVKVLGRLRIAIAAVSERLRR